MAKFDISSPVIYNARLSKIPIDFLLRRVFDA